MIDCRNSSSLFFLSLSSQHQKHNKYNRTHFRYFSVLSIKDPKYIVIGGWGVLIDFLRTNTPPKSNMPAKRVLENRKEYDGKRVKFT